MKLLRIGSNGNEKPAALDKNGKIRDISSILSDLEPRTLNFKNISRLQETILYDGSSSEQGVRVQSLKLISTAKNGHF